ncbi:hypothetical protein [Lysobacter changpingensis]|uniref:hypothetical protein n=1 Tax=Lysobacter changpingensis TaxID=2792784 RepID=UPI001A8E4D6F|nr:hypothetical protein [Lysobacter changpingensis]
MYSHESPAHAGLFVSVSFRRWSLPLRNIAGLLLVVIAGCGSGAPPVYRNLHVLPDGSLELDGMTGELGRLQNHLGDPESIRVNIVGCPQTPYRAVARIASALESAGYRRVGFVEGDSPRAKRLCSQAHPVGDIVAP